MNSIYITLAVEDLLSEVVLRKIIEQVDTNFCVNVCLGRKGNGYLKKNINAFNYAAQKIPYLVLTDQDSVCNCPPRIIDSWFKTKVSPNMIFRVAVMEVEAWVLAHREEFSNFLGIPTIRIPNDVDTIENPKEFLVNLARKSRIRRLRDDLVPRDGSTASIGPDYNNRLSGFINDIWDVKVAINHSDSLNRVFLKLQNFEPVNQIV